MPKDPTRISLFTALVLAVPALGITQAAQGIYPYRELNLHLLWMLLLPMMMRLGQGGLSPWVGRLSDRIGNRPVMIVSQAFVALGPLFYLFATPEMPGWIREPIEKRPLASVFASRCPSTSRSGRISS